MPSSMLNALFKILDPLVLKPPHLALYQVRATPTQISASRLALALARVVPPTTAQLSKVIAF